MEIGTIKLINLEDEIRNSYLDYAMSVITARALPDVRDGLKPVQRRILFGMHELGLRPGSAYKKSARIVGEVLGKYHPHGDSSVYEAMVRLAQAFSMRYILVDGQGNFGSVDGDPPAAQRYTEARLAPISEEVLADIDRDTVDFTPNFDGSLQEPSVLPTRLPNLLVNGSSGIAVGMATNIPPHNVVEVVDALAFMIDRIGSAVDAGAPFELVWSRVHGASLDGEALVAATRSLPRPFQALLKERAAAREGADRPAAKTTPEALGHALLELIDEKADVTPDELMTHIKGPDFPTGGIIIGAEGIRQAYTTGRGRVTVRAKVRTEDMRGGRQSLVVAELPYQINKATLIEKIAELIRDRRIEGISDIRDESDREGMRLVIELKRDVAPRQVLNQLYKFTALQSAFSTNMVALVDGQPRVLTLKAALLHYVSFRRDVITRRTQHELTRARQRAHILEGLKIALDNLDAVIATIRASRDAETARDALMRKFKLTEIQAQAILDMQLRRLAALEREKILAELAEVRKLIAKLEDLLAHPIKILGVVAEELRALKERFGDARRTAIVEKEVEEFTDEDLIPEQEVVVVVSARDYAKRMPADAYRARGRTARGQVATSSREDDAVQHLLVTRTHHSLLLFSNQGRAFQVKAHELPEASRQARGLPLVNLVRLAGGETVTAVVSVPEFDGKSFICLVTRGGEVKRLVATDLASARASGLMVMSLPPGDELGWARLTNGSGELILCSASGQAIRFKEDEVRPSGRGSGGVRAIRLDEGDRLAGADVVEPNGELVLVSQQGTGKRVPLAEFPLQGRGGGGVRGFSVNSKTGQVAAARVVAATDDLLVISAEGMVAQTSVENVPWKTRATQGAPIAPLEGADRVVAVARLRAVANADPNGGKGANGKVSAPGKVTARSEKTPKARGATAAAPAAKTGKATAGKSAAVVAGADEPPARNPRAKAMPKQAPAAIAAPIAGPRARAAKTAATGGDSSGVQQAPLPLVAAKVEGAAKAAPAHAAPRDSPEGSAATRKRVAPSAGPSTPAASVHSPAASETARAGDGKATRNPRASK